MKYETKQNSQGEFEVILFVVTATPKMGFRGPILKTFSQEEALSVSFRLEKDTENYCQVGISECTIPRGQWERKYKTPYPVKQ